ncbi:MAG: AAA family ATPase [Treponema sp.]|nr:AAA family ATPase [Treponema sp.]
MADLFEQTAGTHEPLAARMRPRTLDEYIGQDHIVGKGRLLRRAIAADQLTSVIFYGPPGSGKTTLARVIANHTSSNFITLNAVLTGVADIRKAIQDADDQRKLYSRKTILFVDEVHRWNKSQQDALLPWVENGTIILIGATTENPFFEVNKALVSRSRVFQLKPLTRDDLLKAAQQALQDVERGYGHWKVEFETGALEHLVDTANGDARSLLNALELAVETTPEVWAPTAKPPVPSWGSTIYISKEAAEESIQKKVVLYDRDGDYHYDIISAFIKSLRGRDPDAACYWLARMVKAGEDPHFIFRRMLISACEDTGLADPHAISVVESCAQAFDRVGLPEGRYFLAHAALYLSTAPKSNSSMAFFDALASVEKEDADVPNHLKDASRDAEGFGHGAGYLYPHAYRDHWVAQQYLPDALVGRVFYTPSTQGYEANIHEEVLSRREAQIASLIETGFIGQQVNPIGDWWMKAHFKGGSEKKEENLTYSPENKQKSAILDRAQRSWMSRLETTRAQSLLTLRNSIMQCAHILRHHRVLVWNADDMLLTFECVRLTAEGTTCAVCRSAQSKTLIDQYASTLSQLDKPQVALLPQDATLSNNAIANASLLFNDVQFDRLLLRDMIAKPEDAENLAKNIQFAFSGNKNAQRDIAFDEEQALNKDIPALLAPDAVVILSQRIPKEGQHLSKYLHATDAQLAQQFDEAENSFFTENENPLFSFSAESIEQTLTASGLSVGMTIDTLSEQRHLSAEEIERWFSSESQYGSHIRSVLGKETAVRIQQLLTAATKNTAVTWNTPYALYTCRLSK